MPRVDGERVLDPKDLRRYADAIVKASLNVGNGDTLVVTAEPAHRELAVALSEAGYRAGALIADVWYTDPLVIRARLEHAREESLGLVTPWADRRYRELIKPTGARVAITGDSDPGYLDGIPPKRIAADLVGAAKRVAYYRRANLDMRARWTGVAWPTDYWAGRIYPELSALEAKRRLARDLLWFCRLTDADGKGSTGWTAHLRRIEARSAKLSRLRLAGLELRGPGTKLDLGLAPGTRWLGGREETPWGVKVAPNMPTEESFTGPHAAATNGTFTCSLPLSFQGRLIEGLRGVAGRRQRHPRAVAERDFTLRQMGQDLPRRPLARRVGALELVGAPRAGQGANPRDGVAHRAHGLTVFEIGGIGGGRWHGSQS